METLLVVLTTWAEASVGMKILGILAIIACIVLFLMCGHEVLNKTTGRMEWEGGLFSKLGCLTRFIIVIVCIAIILIWLQLDGNYVFWKP